ncbi:endothelin-converting enzyme 1-like isoform X2 [Prorops nasuta]
MDESVKPCDNFYKFMCGNLNKNFTNEDKEYHIDTFAYLETNVKNRIIDMLRNKKTAASTKAFEIARSVNEMCLDSDTLNENGFKILNDKLTAIGGWPLTNSLIINAFTTWQNKLKQAFQNKRFNPFFTITTVQNLGDTRSRIIRIDQPTILLPLDIDEYKKQILDFAWDLETKNGKRVRNAWIRKDIDEMVNFEISLAMIRVPSSRKTPIIQTIMNGPITISAFQNLYLSSGGHDYNARINWLESIQLLFKQVGINITDSEFVSTQYMEYFKNLPQVLQDATPRAIINYIIWTWIRKLLNYSNTRYIEERGKFLQIETNDVMSSTEEDRYSTCFSHPNLNKAISFEYTQRYFPENVKQKSQEIINHIVQISKEAIGNTEWMDEVTRQRSAEKIASIVQLVGYPDFYSSPAIDEYYSNFKLAPNYLENILNLERLNDLKVLSLLREPFSRKEWDIEPTLVNAFYTRTTNSIIVAAAFLQYPVVDVDIPDVLIYAMLGNIIAHEIFHSFDAVGHRFDKDGNLADWWPPHMFQLYNERSKCFVEQFSNFVVSDLSKDGRTNCVNGERTLSENIADTTALHISFNTLLHFLKYNNDTNNLGDLRLESLKEYNVYKLFFMQFAKLLCGSETPEQLERLNDYDCHAVPEIRVNGAISNHKLFPQVFHCAADAPMNPSKKCSIVT